MSHDYGIKNGMIYCKSTSFDSMATTFFYSFIRQSVSRSFSFFSPKVKRALIGLARDLRGVAFAFNTKTSYMMLFEWLYPKYTPILLRAVAVWFADPQVTTPVLKVSRDNSIHLIYH